MGILEEAIESFTMDESLLHSLPLHSQFLHRHLLLVDEFAHLDVIISTFSLLLLDYLVADVLLAFVAVALASLAVHCLGIENGR